jgi:hypothetical protein
VKLILNEPVAVPWPGSGQDVFGVYWVRIYRAGNRAVVIVADVPGNPGCSPVNGESAISLYISGNYLADVARVRWFACFPAGHPGDLGDGTEYLSILSPAPAATGERAPRRVSVLWRHARRWRLLPTGWCSVRLAIRGPLRHMPPHPEVLELVLAAGGELREAPSAECYAIVPVAEVPPPHHPFRCAHAQRFERFVEASGGRDRKGWVAREIRERFYAQLAPEDFAACPYHDGDWLAIAQESVRIIRQLGGVPDPDALLAALKTARLSDNDRSWLWSMFRHEPIRWSGDQYIGGQHRGCALRMSGADEVVRLVDGPPSGEPGTWTITGHA